VFTIPELAGWSPAGGECSRSPIWVFTISETRTTQAEHDRRVELARTAPGRYAGRLAPLPIGRFHVSLEPAADRPGGEGGHEPNVDAAAWRLARPYYYPGGTATLELAPETRAP